MGHLKTLDEEGTTIVQVTHSAELNARYAGRVIHLLDGQILGDETV